MFQEDRVDVEIETVNGSPFILDDWEEEDRIAAGRPPKLDLSQLDLSVKVTISLKIFKVVFN